MLVYLISVVNRFSDLRRSADELSPCILSTMGLEGKHTPTNYPLRNAVVVCHPEV